MHLFHTGFYVALAGRISRIAVPYSDIPLLLCVVAYNSVRCSEVEVQLLSVSVIGVMPMNDGERSRCRSERADQSRLLGLHRTGVTLP